MVPTHAQDGERGEDTARVSDSVETALDLVRLLPDGYTIEVRPAIHIEGYDG